MEKISIGIDLGTTTTLIAVARDANTLHVLDIFQNNREGKEIESKYLKSVAYFPPIVDSSSNSSEPYVGLQAEYFGQQDSTRFVRTVKRQMGRRILLPVVEKEPYQVAALYLEKALATARRRLSGDMLFTVTVPASFTSNQRADTLRALKLACEKNGVRFPENVGDIFISEPVAAVLAFLDKDIKRPVHLRQLNYDKKTNRLIVYDIGGGTTDLTLVFIETRQEPVKSVTDLSIKVEEISYYNPFGGEDFDLEIAENIYQKFLENHPELKSLHLTDEERLGVRLQFASIAKDVKENLSNKYRNSVLLEDDNPFEDEEKQPIVDSYRGEIRVRGNSYICQGEMSWDDLKGCVETLVKTENRRGVISPLRSLLEKSRFSPKEIDGLLLVGGMAQFPLLEEVLKAEFDAEKVWKFDPPDHAIVMGAALYSFLRANSPGFSLDEPAADAYYVWTDKGFDQILPSRTREWIKKEYELKRDTSELILQLFSGEDAAEDRREEIYHTLIYQGAVRVDLEKVYPKGTKVWVQVRYEGVGSALDHSKLPYLYVWIENPESEPKKVPYSEILIIQGEYEMNRVFEPLELDLGDARLLPNRVIEVQEKIEELLSPRTNLHRREALVEDLCSQKAWVLPGLINATMVFADQLDNKKNFNQLAKILSTIAKDNPAAINLLLKSGIYQNPFYKSRAVIVEALRQLEWQPDDVKPIKNLLKTLKDDDLWVLDLYRLYLRSKSETAYREGINLCEEWFRIPKDVAKDLFQELLINYPEKAGDIISRVFLAVTEISEGARKDKEYSIKVIGYIPTDIAVEIVKEGVLTEISKDVLEDIYVPRHRIIEKLWEYSIKELSKNKPQFEELDLIAGKIFETGKLCSSQVRESIYRYWMQGLGNAGLIEYLITQMEKDDEVYQLQSVIQLFFQQNDKRAKQVLSDLERDNPLLYSKAQENYETIKNYKNTNINHIQERQAKKGSDLSEK